MDFEISYIEAHHDGPFVQHQSYSFWKTLHYPLSVLQLYALLIGLIHILFDNVRLHSTITYSTSHSTHLLHIHYDSVTGQWP